MDRDGEELVAIVEGLDVPGVTLTVSNRARHSAERRRPSRTRIHINTVNRLEVSPVSDRRQDTMPAAAGMQSQSGMPATQRASVETTTGVDFEKTSKSSQICDDRYTSSYKLAHCQMTPTSPPEGVSEFPPQRREPCRNQGNFEIGGYGSAQWSFHSEQGNAQGFKQASRSAPVRASTSKIRHNGGKQILRDQGSSHRYCNSKRDTEAFEHSLRKYPSMAPFRTASNDLIEKLIRYTQAKNFQEMSRSSKSARSLRHQKSADTDDLASKHQQTCTRGQDNNLPSSSGAQVGNVGRTRNFKLYSPISDSRNLRNRETVFSTSYDYLKAGSSPDRRSNRSDGSRSPTGSKSPEDSKSPAHSPVRFGSPTGSKRSGSPGSSRHPERPIRFERSVRDLSLSEMSKYIRNTVRQICNEKPVVFQVCPKLKSRYNQHKKVCPSKSEQTSDLVEQAGCQCNRTDCFCTRATQCAYEHEVSTNTVGCSCRTRTIEAKTSCSRDLTCVCARKAQAQAYYNKGIDEAIFEWLKDVPVQSVECAAIKKKKETAINELRETLKHLSYDNDVDENIRNEINSFIDSFWNPEKDEDEMMFKQQLADKLIDKIVAIPRKSDRFRDIVTKWVENLNFEDDNNEQMEMKVIIDNIVNKLKLFAAERPACDMKYTHILRKEITELLNGLPLNYDCVMLKRITNQLATEIVNLPRNIKLGESDSASMLEENLSEWICDHGLCRELKNDPKLIEGLANKLKSRGIGDVELMDTMKGLIFEFMDDVETAIGILDEFGDELMKTSTVQKDNLDLTQQMKGHGHPEAIPSITEVKRFNEDELNEVVVDWLSNLPGAFDFSPSKFKKVIEDICKIIQYTYEELENDLFEYLIDTGLPIDPADLHEHVEELLEFLYVLPPSDDLVDQSKRNMVKEMFIIIDTSSMSVEKQKELKKSAFDLVEKSISMMPTFKFVDNQDEVKEALLSSMSQMIDKVIIPSDSQEDLKNRLTSSMRLTFDKSFARLSKDESDLKLTIDKNVRKAVEELPVGTNRKEDLMEQVNKILCKCMNKPLPPNFKNIINDNISYMCEKGPIAEDRSLCGRLKKALFDVVGQHLDFFLPKPLCDFQCKIEKDVGMVIDRCPIDPGSKRQLKKCLQDIFTENGDRTVSEEVVRSIQEEINCVCSDLLIPKDKKEFLKNSVGASVSKNLNEALSSLSHDLNKLRKRLYNATTNVIEKSPITRDVKSNLKSQLKSVLVKTLDSSLSDKETHNILDEVSDILKYDMPEDERRNLTNRLSNTIDTFQRKSKTKDQPEMVTKDVDQLLKRLSIDSGTKEDVKKDVKAALLDTLYNPLTPDKQHEIKEDIMNKIDQMDIPKHEKKYLKSNIAHAMTKELNILIGQGKEVPEIKTALEETIRNEIKDSSISKDKKELLDHKLLDVLADNLVRDVSNEEKAAIPNKLGAIIDDLNIDKGKSEALKTQLLKDADKYIEKSAPEKMRTKQAKADAEAESAAADERISDYQRDYNTQNKILQGLENSIDEASIPEEKKIELKEKLKNISAKNLKKALSSDATALTKSDIKELENKTKQNILRGLKIAVDEAPISEERKKELNNKLEDLTAKHFKSQLSDDVPVAFKDDIDEIIDEMNLPKDKKDKLKSELTATVDDNMRDLRSKTQPSQKRVEDFKTLEKETKGNIVRGLENVIDETPLPKVKKMELKKKLEELKSQHFKNQLSDDFAVGLKDDMDDIIDEMNLPKDKKDKLKTGLTATVDDNIRDLRNKTKPSQQGVEDFKTWENETKGNIVRGLENVVDEAPLPKEKKMELMKKLDELKSQHFKNQLSDDVAVGLKDDMDDIIDEMNLPKYKKDKLKKGLTATVDDNMRDLTSKTQPSQKGVEDFKTLEEETKGNIVQGLENVVDEAPLPKEKKIELMKKIQALTAYYFKNQLSDDVAVGLKDDMDDIIDEMNLPRDKKDKLKSELTATVDDNMRDLRSKTQPSQKRVEDFKTLEEETKGNIVQGLENVVDEAPQPKEKKMELMKKLKELKSQHFKNQLSDDVAVELKDDMDDIIDEMNLPKDKKDKLKKGLTATVDDNMRDLRSKTQPSQKRVEDFKTLEEETKGNIVQGLENVVDEAPLPKEKKMELMKKLKELKSQHFKNQLSDDVAVELKDDMDDIIDEMNLPKDKKDKLKKGLTATVDDNMRDLRSKTQPSQKGVEDFKTLEEETKGNIVQGLENVVDEAPLPKEKKMELMKKLKELKSQHFKNQLSDDVAVELKDDMDDIINEMNLPKDKKDKLKSDLTATVDDNMSDLRSKTKQSQKGVDDLKALDKKTKGNIKRIFENIIDRAPIPKDKKIELMKKIQALTAHYFKNQLSDDVAVGLKDDMDDIIDEMNLPKYKKDKLKKGLTATVDDNMRDLRSKTQPSQKGVEDFKTLEEETKGNIVQGLENVVDEAPLPKEKKMELMKKLEELNSQHFKNQLSDDVAVGLKDDMDDIIDEMNLPKDKKDKLKSDLTATVDDNMSDLRSKTKQSQKGVDDLKALDKETKGNIERRFENIIDRAPIPKDKKIELMKKIQALTAQYFKHQLSDDIAAGLKDDMDEIIDDMNLPKDKKDKLKSELTATVDDNMRDLRSKTKQSQKGVKDFKALDTETKINIVRGLENVVDAALLPKEKNMELKKHLKDLTTHQFNSRLSDDVAEGLKDDMDDIIGEMNLPEHKKDKLKKDLTSIVDDNMINLRSKTKSSQNGVEDFKAIEKKTKENIIRGLENVVDEAPLPKEKKMELMKKLEELKSQHLINQLSDDVAVGLKDDMDDIIDEMNLPNDKKDKLKSELTATVDDNMRDLRSKTQPSQKRVEDFKTLEEETKGNIEHRFENIIDRAPIPKDKKIELMKKIQALTANYFKNQLSDDVAVGLKDDMDDIIDEMNLPKDKKDKLKSELTATVDDNMRDLRSKTQPSQKRVEDFKTLEKKTKGNIVRGLENVVDEAPLPKEKKMELMKKLEELKSQHFKNQLSDDVAVELKDDMDDIINEMNLPKDKKDKLKSDLTATVDDNMSDLRSKTKQSQKGVDDLKALDKKTKGNIKRIFENIIDRAPIPKDKKIELMKKIQALTAHYFKNQLSDDVAVGLKGDMDDIIDEMNLPKYKKDKLKKGLTATVDDNMRDLRSKTQPSQKGVEDFKTLEEETKGNIVQGLENVVDEAPLPKEKKMELMKKLKELKSQHFKNQLSDDVAVELKDDMDDIIDEMNLPKDKKDKLKKGLTATVDDNMRDLRSKTQPSQKGVEDFKTLEEETKGNIVQGLENVVDEAPLPKEKKMELMKKLKELKSQHFKNQLSDDVAVELKDDMDDIINEMNLTKDKKDKLKSDLTATVDDNMSDLRSKTKQSQKGVDDLKALDKKTKGNIKRIFENIIDRAPIPKDKKIELMKKIQALTAHYFKNQLSDDVAVGLKDDMDDIIDEMNLPKYKKDKLKKGLTATVDDNMRDLRSKTQPSQKGVEDFKTLEEETKGNIVQGLENDVDEAPLPKEKKMELMKKLEELNSQHFKNQLSDDVAVGLKDDMDDIIDEMNLPKDKKDKLKSDLTATVDDNMSDLRSKTKQSQKGVDDLKALDKETKGNIERRFENIIDRAPIPKDKKIELMKKIQALTAQYFKHQLSDDIAAGLKDDMDEIIDDMNLPKDKKDKLKSELTATVDDNMRDLRSKTKQSQKGVKDFKALDTETKINIVRGLENVVDAALLPKEKNMELKKHLKDLTTHQFNSRLSDDVAEGLKDDMDDIIGEMNLPEHKKDKLKKDLTSIVDDNMINLRSKTKSSQNGVEDFKAIEKKTKENIIRGLENVIDAALLPKEKKMGLKKHLKDLTTQQFKSALSEDVAVELKDDMDEIIDEMNLPKDKKDTLKSELTAAVNDNMRDLSKIKPSQKRVEDFRTLEKETKGNIVRGLENVVDAALLPKEKKMGLKKHLKDLTTQQFKSALSEDVAVGLKDDMDDIIDEMNLPEHKKDKLKKGLTSIVDDNMINLRSKTKSSQNGVEDFKTWENETKENIIRGLENVVDEAPLPKEKKMELMKKLEELKSQHFKNQLSDDVAVGLKDDMDDIIDEMNLPKDKKDTLKSELTATVDDNMRDLSKIKPSQKGFEDFKTLEKETKGNIIRGIENVVDEAPLPKEKKMELKKQMKNLTTQQFKSRLSDDVAVGLKDDMDEIIDEMNLPKDKKDKLKSELTATVDDNMSDLRSKTKQSQKGVKDFKALDTETKINIVRRLENVVDAALLPKEKNMELKKHLKDLTTHQFNSRLSDDVAVGLKDDMDDIIGEMNLPEHKKDKLKKDLTSIVDDNMINLRRKTKSSQNGVEDYKAIEKRTKENIIRGLENVVDAALLPKEKNMELKKHLKDLTTHQFKSRLSDDVAVGLKDDMDEIIDVMNLPKDKKDKLKSELTATVDDNMRDLRSKTKPSQKGIEDFKTLEKETKGNIVRGIENVIDEAPLPKEKKMELMKQIKDLTTKQFKSRLSDDVAVGLKDDMDEIIDEINLTKDKKDKLKKGLTAAVDDNMGDSKKKKQDADSKYPPTKSKELENETKVNMQQDLEKVINKAPISKEEKLEFKKQVQDLSTKHFKKPLSDNALEALINEINEVMGELNLPQDLKNKLKREVAATLNENMSDFKDSKDAQIKSREKEAELENKTKENIQQDLEKVINKAPISKEEKLELKKQVQDLSTKHFKKPLSANAIEALINEINEVMGELNLPQDLKDKLKREVTATLDENMSDFKDSKYAEIKPREKAARLENEAKENIQQDLEKVINKAPISKEEKLELKKQVQDLSTKHFKKPLSANAIEALINEINEVIGELNLPQDLKDKLKREVTATLDENMSDFKDSKYAEIKSREKEARLENEAKENIQEDLEKVINKVPIPKEEKLELKKQVQDLSTKHFKKPLSDNAIEALINEINEVIGELNLPQDLKDKLKREVSSTLEENMSDFKDSKYAQIKSSKKGADLENETKVNIKQGLENVINEAPIPKDQKLEFKIRVQDLSTKHFKKPLSDEVVDTFKDDVHKTADGLNLPKYKKDELKDELTATVDENIRNLKKVKDDDSQTKRRPGLLPIKETTKKDRILQGIQKVIEKSAIPDNKKHQWSGVLHKMAADNLQKRLSNNMQDKGSTEVDDVHELKSKTKSNILLGQEEAVDKPRIPKELRNYLKKKLQELTKKHFMRPLTDDTAQAIKNDINKVIDDLNLTEDLKDQLKIELAETVDENMKKLLKQLAGLNKKPVKEKPEIKVDKSLQDIFNKYGIDPSYANQLAKEFNKLLEIARKGGDFEDARKKLIKKLMLDLNLPEEEASALSDEMIERARLMTLKEKNKDIFNKYGIDPNYEDQLTKEFNKLLEIARKGGDFEDARKKLIKKIMRDLTLPEEEAIALTNELIDRARLMALLEQIRDILDKYGVDPNYENQLAEEFNKFLKIGRKGGDFEEARKKLIKKLMRDLNLPEEEASALTDELIDRARKMPLKDQIGDIFDKYGVDPSYEDQLAKEFNNLLEIAREGGYFEDARKKLIKKLMRDLNLPEEEASALTDELIDRARKMALKEQIRDIFDKYGIDSSYQDKLAEEYKKLLEIALNGGDLEDARRKLINKLMRDLNLSEAEASALAEELIARARKELFGQAIRDAVDESTLAKYGVDPNYEDQLNEEFNDLLEIARMGGDFEDARKKLIKKLMRDLNLPEEEASALVDELIDRARKMALKDKFRDIFDKYGIDSSYQDKLAEEYKKLLEIALNGGDLEDARRKLINKLMRDLNLSEAEASALADELIARARKELFGQAIRDAVDESTLANAEKPILKNKLLNKMKQILDKKPFIYKEDIGLKKEFLKECNEIIDESSIPTDKKNELKSLLKEKLNMAFEDEDAKAENLEDYKDKITKIIKKFMNTLPIDLEPKVGKTVADNIASDILDRNKYLLAHPEAKHSEKDEIENLKYQVFRRMHRVVKSKAMPKVMAKTPDLYKSIMKIKPPPPEPKRPPKPTLPLEEDPAQKKMKELKKVFAESVDEAIVDSSLSKPDKSTMKKRLLEDLGITWADDKAETSKDRKKAEKYDVGPPDVMDKSPTAIEYKKRIRECVKTWLQALPIDLDPKTAATIADYLTDDILERQKYLRTHLKASTDEDEIENLMYQVFRRLKDIVDPEGIPDIMKRTEDLYNMIMNIKKQMESQERCTSSKRRRDPSPPDRKMSTVAALSTGNINYSLREIIASTRGVRKQWSRNLEDAITKLPNLKKDENLKDTLAIYDETGQIDILSSASRSIAGTSTYQGATSKKQLVPKTVPKNKGKSRLTKIEEAFAFNNTIKQNSPFNANQNQITEKNYVKLLNDIIQNWLGKAKVNIAPNEMNKIVDELVLDMVDRQKYLQEFKITNSSPCDDFGYLKLQVHRRLNSLVPVGELKKIVEGMEELAPKIENVQIPQMVATTDENVKTPAKSSIKSPVSKKKLTKQKKNIQTNPSNAADADTLTDEVPQTVDDDALEHEISNTEFSPGQSSTPTKTSGEKFMDKVSESITTWIQSVPINLEPEVQTEFVNDLTSDITDRQKYLQAHPEKMILKKEEIENLRFQVFKRLDKVTDDESLTPDIDKIEELYKMINGDGRRRNLTPKEAQEFQTTLPDEIAAVLNDYNICCERRELLSSLTKELAKLGNTGADQDEIIENLIDAIKRITYLSDCDMCDDEAEDLAYKLLARTKKLIARIQSKGAPVKRRDFREALMNDIGDVFQGCPMSADKRRMMECQLVDDYAKDLGIPLQDSEVTVTGEEGHYGMSFNGLTNFIDTWLSSIHTEDDDTKGESEINDIKKDKANSLIHKIGEMNVDPEIFNDDALYEAVLRDELENMLGDITITDAEIDALKEDLINKVLEAKQRAHDEFAGQAYKRNLRETISKVLPDQRNLSKEEQATMSTLKDQLADAYIDLHFSGNNEPQREKLKKKISNELNRFCKDYMNRVPCAPLSSQKINQALYAALNAVPLPPKDSIRYEVEQARIREEINDWLKELPIQPQNPTELLARNKMVYVLAKKLFDFEIEGNDTDNDSKRGEIVKFLNKLPLETEEDLETIADGLIDKLQATEESRKYNALSNVTLDCFGNVSREAAVCSKHKSLFEKRKASPGPSDSQVCGRPTCKHHKPMPPCTLSPEDKEHLERIRRRTSLSPSYVRSIMKDNAPLTCPGMRPVDAGSKTMLRPHGYHRPRSPTCRIADERPPRLGSGQPANAYSQQRREPWGKDKPQRAPVCPVSQQRTAGPGPGPSRLSPQCVGQSRRHTITSTNMSDCNEEVEPQITIKKYYWNPNDKNSAESEKPQNARGNRGDPSLSHQTSTTQSEKIRISSSAQCSPPPCGRPSFGKLRQQDTGPDPAGRPGLGRPAPFQPPCAPTPCMSPFRLNNQPSPPSSAFSKRDNECRIPKRDGLDHQDQMPCSSRPFCKERVIELGSLDNLSNARPKKRHNDANEWQFEEEEVEDNFWSSPIRRVVLDEGIDDSVVMEREQREERIRCKCKERLVPKYQAGRAPLGSSPSQQFTQGNEGGQNLKKCAKCCGRHCPYPSYLYFRQ